MDTGVILSIKGQIVEIEFVDKQPSIGDILVHNIIPSLFFEVFTSTKKNRYYCLTLGDFINIKRRDLVTNTKSKLAIPNTKNIVGRAFDIFFNPIDGKDKLTDNDLYFGGGSAVDLSTLALQNTILETGIKAIDFFCPLLRGGKVGIFGGAGVGKTVLLTELMEVASKNKQNTLSVFSAVGERLREAQELYEQLSENGLINSATLIIGQMGESPAIRFKTAEISALVASFMRDVLKKDVFFFMDNMYRFAQAGSELSTLMSYLPSEDGYQPNLNQQIAKIQQQLYSTNLNSITSIQAVFVPSDDINDFAVKSVFPYLDTSIVMDRQIYQQGYLPAINLVSSASVALNPNIVGQLHFKTQIEAKKLLEQAINIERIVKLIGVDELSIEDKTIYNRSLLIKAFMTQNFFCTKSQSGFDGVSVSLQKTVEGVNKILEGTLDNTVPSELMYKAEI